MSRTFSLGAILVVLLASDYVALAEDARLKRAKADYEKKVARAKRALIDEYGAAITRAKKRDDQDEAAQLLAEMKALQAELTANKKTKVAIRADKYYRCVLGIYGVFGNETPYPVVNLTPPNKNLWTAAIQDKLRGKIPFEEINYNGKAQLVIPKDGEYKLELARGVRFEVDGVTMNGGAIQLRRGVHLISFYTHFHGQPYLPGAFAKVIDPATGDEIPFVNSGRHILQFLAQRVSNVRVVEVSDYEPIIVKLPK